MSGLMHFVWMVGVVYDGSLSLLVVNSEGADLSLAIHGYLFFYK